MDLNYSELDKNDFDKVASKLEISTKVVEEVYTKYFEVVRDFMALKTMPLIKTRIITAYPSGYKFKKKFRNMVAHGLKENFREFLKTFWHVFERIKNEKIGKATHLEWMTLERAERRYKDKSLYELIIKKLVK
jgi:hypothetical protein